MSKNNIYALLIGVGNYKELNLSDLPSYRMDLALIGTAMMTGLKCEKEHIRFMAGADNNGIVRTSDFAKGIASFERGLTEEDTFILYFSGHGGAKSLFFSDGAIEQQSVINYIDKLPGKNKIFILDCCYSGKFEMKGPKHLHMEQTLEEFAGHGIAVYASSTENEVSRLGIDGKSSVFTGMLTAALLDPALVRKGRIELGDIYRRTQQIIEEWNRRNPGKEQHPIFRSSLGGTIYFEVEETKTNTSVKMVLETEVYKVTDIKSLSTAREKRLCAFVRLKRAVTVEERAAITKEIAAAIKYTDIPKKKGVLPRKIPAEAVWCYFGNDASDMVNHSFSCYTIWASDKVKEKYYKENENACVIHDIYLFENKGYELVRKLQSHSVPKQKYIEQYQAFLRSFINHAEDFLMDLQEVENGKLTVEELQTKYQPWVKEVKRKFIALSDTETPPDELHDWAEEIWSLAGWVSDIGLLLDGEAEDGKLTERSKWLIEQSRRHYYESIEKLKELEKKLEGKKDE